MKEISFTHAQVRDILKAENLTPAARFIVDFLVTEHFGAEANPVETVIRASSPTYGGSAKVAAVKALRDAARLNETVRNELIKMGYRMQETAHHTHSPLSLVDAVDIVKSFGY